MIFLYIRSPRVEVSRKKANGSDEAEMLAVAKRKQDNKSVNEPALANVALEYWMLWVKI